MSTLRIAAITALVVAAAAPAAHGAPTPLLSTAHTTITGEPWLHPINVQNAGDVNGDGREDLIVQNFDRSVGWVVFGAASPSTLDLGSLGTRGFPIVGGDATLRIWAPLGDVNGDGRDDLGIREANGTAKIVYGRTATTPVTLSALGTQGLTVTTGPASPSPNITIRGLVKVGDLNGDGRDDIGLTGRYRPPGVPVSGSQPGATFLFGRAGGGTVDLSTETGQIALGDAQAAGREFSGLRPHVLGDVNRDGRDDIVVERDGPGGDGNSFVLYGRAQGAILDVSSLGNAATQLPGRRYGYPTGDINGDGLQDQVTGGPGVSTVFALTSLATPVLDFGSAARTMTLTASTGQSISFVSPGDLTGDGRDDAAVSAHYRRTSSSPFLGAGNSGVNVPYVHTGSTAGTTDVRVAGRRIDGPAQNQSVFTALRFTGAPGDQLVTTGANGAIVVHTLGPKPADTTAPVLTGVRFGATSIQRANDTSTARTILDYRVNETAYLELDIRRGTTLVASSKGLVQARTAVPAGEDPDAYTFQAIYSTGGGCGLFGCSYTYARLPAGTYTATLRASDVDGNRGAPQTATITVRER